MFHLITLANRKRKSLRIEFRAQSLRANIFVFSSYNIDSSFAGAVAPR